MGDISTIQLPDIRPGRYDTVAIGKYSDGTDMVLTWGQVVFIYHVEKVCNPDNNWTVLQGCLHLGKESGGTHAGKDIADVTPYNETQRLHTIKNFGGFGWIRDGRDSPDWAGAGSHIHWGILNSRKMSAEANAQRRDYRLGLNGLANHAKDRYHYRADPPVSFDYKAAYAVMKQDQQLTEAERILATTKKGSKLYNAILHFIIRFRRRSKTDH